MRSFTATANDEGVRLSRFVSNVTSNLPASLLHKSFRNKRIKVNGKKQAPDYRLSAGDNIELYLNDEFFHDKASPAQSTVFNKSFSSTIVWEDNNLAVLYKPAGVLCHGSTAIAPSLLADFTQYLIQKEEYLPQQENQFAPALCNRLDQGTEGLVLAAKKYSALRDANQLLREGLISKTYLCVVSGQPPEGIFNAFLLRNKQTKKTSIHLQNVPGAKPITTGVHVLEKGSLASLCEINLLTGRTHQIRAHLAFLGHPIIGDHKYSSAASLQLSGKLTSQLLCAYSLVFSPDIPTDSSLHYLKGKTISLQKCEPLTWWKTNCK